MDRDLVSEGADASAAPHFFGKPWLAAKPMRPMPCSHRCAQDATSTRDTRRVLSSAVHGVSFVAPSLCQNVCKIHHGDRPSGRSEASF